jgi:hypothetical protein
MAQLGVFLIPPPEHPLYRIATGIIGYDIWARQTVQSSLSDDLDQATLRQWTGRASEFGLHCTIAGADIVYRDEDVDEIKDRLAWIAGRTPPFTVTDGRYFDDFPSNPHALVTRLDDRDGELQRLHERVVTMVSPLHVSSFCTPPRDPDDARAWAIYTRTGESGALERFLPHWSLLTSLPDQSAWTLARELISRRTGLFADERTRTLHVDDVHLVRRGDAGSFSVIASFPLTGG